MQCSLEKKTRKKKMNSSSPSQVPVNGLCYKMGQSIHQCYYKFFHVSQNIYQETEKNRKTDVVKTESAYLLSYNIC